MTGPVSVGRPDAIIFDCDGVVLESEEMKIAAFLDVLPQDPRRLEEVRRYYQEYSGLPRHEKLQHIFHASTVCRWALRQRPRSAVTTGR